MKAIIIEDELPAAKRLKTVLNEVDDSVSVLEVIESVSSAVKWFQHNSLPDIVFMDIQLSDGLSFDIFKSVDIKCPIIFTTAFDEYAIQAFKVNSIDYLLKPIETKDMERSLNKLKELKSSSDSSCDTEDIKKIIASIRQNKPAYKTRFLIKSGQTYFRINTNDCAYFYVDNKLTFLVTFSAKKYLIDYTLEDLEAELDPQKYFRVNRQFILNIDSIADIHSYFSGKLKIKTKLATEEEIIISRIKAIEFKSWIDG